MKQTAVEWLFEQMLDDKLDRRYEILAEAKKMENKQRIEAANNFISAMKKSQKKNIRKFFKSFLLL